MGQYQPQPTFLITDSILAESRCKDKLRVMKYTHTDMS
jgi:hypothetical protein